MALQKAISKKKKSFFQEKIEKNANNSKELWKALKSLGMKSGKVNQSKIALKSNGAIQFEPTKNANIFKACVHYFYFTIFKRIICFLVISNEIL